MEMISRTDNTATVIFVELVMKVVEEKSVMFGEDVAIVVVNVDIGDLVEIFVNVDIDELVEILVNVDNGDLVEILVNSDIGDLVEILENEVAGINNFTFLGCCAPSVDTFLVTKVLSKSARDTLDDTVDMTFEVNELDASELVVSPDLAASSKIALIGSKTKDLTCDKISSWSSTIVINTNLLLFFWD